MNTGLCKCHKSLSSIEAGDLNAYFELLVPAARKRYVSGKGFLFRKLSTLSSLQTLEVCNRNFRTHCIEMKRNENDRLPTKSPWPSSAVEEKRLLLRKAAVIWPKVYRFRFPSSLYVLATLTRGPDDAIIGKCRSVTPSIFVCFMLFQVFPYYITLIT